MTEAPINPAPLLPPEHWWQSAVQRAQFFGLISSSAALIIQLFEIDVDMQIINAKIAILVQLANLGFTVWGMIARGRSKIQPLTLTKAGAEARVDTALIDPATMGLKDSGVTGLAAGQLAGGQPDTAQQTTTPNQ